MTVAGCLPSISTAARGAKTYKRSRGRVTRLPKARRAALAQLAEQSDSEPRLILATGRYLGEGFDDPRLDTLLLTMPIAWKGTVVQYAGRLHRAHPAKRDAL